jgi:hypothetical protein
MASKSIMAMTVKGYRIRFLVPGESPAKQILEGEERGDGALVPQPKPTAGADVAGLGQLGLGEVRPDAVEDHDLRDRLEPPAVVLGRECFAAHRIRILHGPGLASEPVWPRRLPSWGRKE